MGATGQTCRHCGREIIPTEFGTWADTELWEVCSLPDGHDHSPCGLMTAIKSRDSLVYRLEEEGFAGSAEDLLLADDVATARLVASEAADRVERFGFRDGQATDTAHELRRFANLCREADIKVTS